jgi:hypothetical protein
MIVFPGKNEIYDNSMYGHTTVDYALGIMGWMLSPDRPLRAEQDVITKQYQDLVALKKGNYMSGPNYRSMVNLLEPYVPVSARQNQGSSVAAVAPGLASGVPTVSNKGKSEVVLSPSFPSSAVVKASKPIGFVAPPMVQGAAAVSASTSSSSYVVSDEERAKLKDLQSKTKMNQMDINQELTDAATYGQKGIMEWMLSPISWLKPNQKGVNDAFIGVVSVVIDMITRDIYTKRDNSMYGKGQVSHGLEIIEWMLSLPEGKGRPEKDAIIEAYSNAEHRECIQIVNRLKPYAVPARIIRR